MLMQSELKALLDDIYNGMQLPLFVLDLNFHIQTASERFYELPSTFFVDKVKTIDFSNYKIYTLFEKTELYYMIPYPTQTTSMICAGPFLYHRPIRSTSLTNIDFFKTLGIHALSSEQLETFPYVNPFLNQRLRIIYTLFLNERIEESDIKKSYQKESSTNPSVVTQMEDELFHQREDEESKLSHHLEKQMLNYVKKANSTAARSVYNEIVHGGTVHTLSKNQIKSAQFSFVALITLLTRTVMEVGVSEVQAYTMSDVYIKKVDESFTIDQIHSLCNAAILDYTRLVKLNKNNQDVKWVRECKEYIDEHLHEEINLSILSSYLHMNESYLSTQFKKLTKQTIKDYTTQKKIEEAKFLLKNSDLALQDIAFSLQFGSENYFAKVFKTKTGLLPSQYRNQ